MTTTGSNSIYQDITGVICPCAGFIHGNVFKIIGQKDGFELCNNWDKVIHMTMSSRAKH